MSCRPGATATSPASPPTTSDISAGLGPGAVSVVAIASVLTAMIVTVGIAVSPWLWLLALFALLRGIPTALARPLLIAHLARVVPRSYQTGIFGLFPTVGNVGGLIFPLLAVGVVGSGLWTAFAIGSLGYSASVVSGVKLGRVQRHRDPEAAVEPA